MFLGFCQNRFTGHHDAQVNHFEVIAAQHDGDDVLADVVNIAFDGRDQKRTSCRAGHGRCVRSLFRRLPQW